MPGDSLDAFKAQLSHRYRVERELGRGGMATVYLAHDLKHERKVALKALRPEIALILGRERFQREIATVARLLHPNILPLHDSDEAAGRLFYVMPFVEGGTLADRLARGPRASLAEALELVRQVASGLAYAHEQGLVHRDVKPANILLASGHAFIADFGVARFIREAITSDRLTESGLVLGTPAYMAPEQLRGASRVDGRADEYSLACVLYEMLTGAPPGHEASAPGAVRAALAAHPDVPGYVIVALERALASDVTRRFESVGEFVAALDPAIPPTRVSRATPRPRLAPARAAMGLGLLAAVALLGWLVAHLPGGERGGVAGLAPDTSRYVILPAEGESAIGGRLNVEQFLHDALSRWDGLNIVDHFLVMDALGRQDNRPLSSAGAMTLAQGLSAGRYIRSQVSRLGDSIRVHATLYDTPSGGTALENHTIRVPADLSGADSQFASLADYLLFRGALPATGTKPTATRSLPARQAFARGQRELQSWNLVAADSAFAEAGTRDPSYAEAHLWLALVRDWNGEPEARWRYAAEQAAADRAALSTRDRGIADAIVAEAHQDMGSACPRWERLTRQEPADFVVWYGSARCQARDDAVVQDPASPSRWRFRASYQHALRAYRRAFELLPSMLDVFRDNSYQTVKWLLFTSPTRRRSGRALPPDTTTFLATAGWAGDSLVLIPYPMDEVLRSRRLTLSPTNPAAVRHQRELFHDLAVTWASVYPRSADARQALAIGLEMLHDPAALDTIRGARALARNQAERIRVIGTEIWIRARQALPDGVAGLRGVRLLADSVLAAVEPGTAPEPTLLGSIALLTGKVGLAAALLRQAAVEEHWENQPRLMTAGVTLLAWAAAGGPADTLRALEDRVGEAIARTVPAPDRLGAQLEWLGRPASLAFPAVRLRSLTALSGEGDYVIDALAAYDRGDASRARTILDQTLTRQASFDPAARTLDTVLPEAELLAALGDRDRAVRLLEQALSAAPEMTPSTGLELAVHAGCLVRAMILRAQLATANGDDQGARRWGNAARSLWQDGDPAVVSALNRLTPVQE